MIPALRVWKETGNDLHDIFENWSVEEVMLANDYLDYCQDIQDSAYSLDKYELEKESR